MSDDRARRLEQLRQAYETGILDEDTYRAAVAAMEAEAGVTAAQAGAGGLAQVGGVAAGAEGVAVGRDVEGGVHITHHHAAESADPAALRAAYLHRVFETAAHLSLAGVDPKAASGEAEARLSLGAVYTALLTLTAEDHERLARGETPGHGTDRQRLSAMAQLDRHPRLVLLGDPGSGKSTFVNFVALCMAGEALGREDANLGLLTAPLPPEGDRREEREEPQPWRHGALLPVRVVLRDLAARGLPPPGERATAEHLWRFLVAELKAAALDGYADHLARELLKGGGLLLLDGLDEVPEADRRREQIRQAIGDFCATFGRCRVLVTSRTYAYQKQEWRMPGFAEAVLAPFSRGQIEQFVERWYAHIAVVRGLHRDDAQGRAELLKRAIVSSERLQGLAERPLLLTLMASLHAWRGGSLPERREELYADTVDLLLDWWESPKVVQDARGQAVVQLPSLAEWLKVDRARVRDLLNELAYQAHAAQPALTGTADLPEGDLVGGLLRLSQNPDVKPARLVEYLSQRAGLLLPRGVGVFTFPHRTFQEYLAACHLTDRDYPELVAQLAREEPDRWREVALLAGAKAARGTASAVWSLVDALCYRDPAGGEAAPADSWGAHLAGQALVETAGLEQVSERNREKVARVQRWLVHILQKGELPAVERATAGDALAHLCDPRFREDAWFLPARFYGKLEPLLGFIKIPAGPFLMGTQEEDIPALMERFGGQQDWYEREVPQHCVELPAYYAARYPVTVAQFQVFARDSGLRIGDDWEQYSGPDNHPVVAVTWQDARAYCAWLTERLRDWRETPEALAVPLREDGWVVRLPTEAEWEKAARGTDRRAFPWGEDIDPDRANYDATGIGRATSVGCFPRGTSPDGILELSGNVFEWTSSLWGKNLTQPDFKYPYDPRDGREDPEAPGGRVLRGGAFIINGRYVRCASRYWLGPVLRRNYVGFRVMLAPG